jgi:16S rRNA (cytosine967-C5)-methyltransferase
LAGGVHADLGHSDAHRGDDSASGFVAAVAGDQVGYIFGRAVGPSLFDRPRSKLFNPQNVTKAHVFFERHGPKTIVLARFVPIVRTFAPIVAGGRHPNVQAEPAFRKGRFEIQDEGSQLAASLAGASPGMQVLDYCAGAGGKTLAMAAAMDNRGQLFAFDAGKQRLAPIFERLRRAGTRNVQAFADPARLEALEGQCDLVLVDAPCTGSGTWRRRPDAKWRLTERQLEMRQAEQAGILAKASRFVKPGGRLAYVTCSVFPAENSDRVAAFLEENPGFAAEDHAALWKARFPDGEGLARVDRQGGIVMTPARTGTDGFFVALLRRTN